jgi:hypothetical protein
MRILPFISNWAWDQFMWQQLPGLLHLVLQGIYRKKSSTFPKIFAKNIKKLLSILTLSLNPRKEVGLKGSQL